MRGVTLDVERERRILALYESVAELRDDAREQRLAVEDSATADAVRMLIARDARTALLRTLSSETPEPEDRLPERIGPYRIIDVLGRGGMGTVLLGERDDGLFEHRVAIKLLRAGLFSPAARAQFAVERGILARLHHPHIAQLFDGGVDPDGRSYIVMELLDGEPVTDHADARGLGVEPRLTLFLQACDAAEHAHRNLIVHSDIKPSNVLVTKDFGVKLLDFGIARVLSAEATAAIGHTPGYASAAQRAGLPPTPADDVHALGRLLAALLAAFRLDADLAAVVAAAGAPAPAYGAVSELIADLSRWRASRPVAVRHPEPTRRAQLYWRRHRAGVLVVAGALLLLSASTAATTALFLRASRAQAAAEARFEQTRALSRYLLDDVAEALEPLPGSSGLRRAIAEHADRTFAELGRVPGASDALRIDGAEAQTRIGAILTGASKREGANPAAAGRALSRAVAVLETMHREHPAEQTITLALARALTESGRFFARIRNDDAQAERLARRTAAVLRSLPPHRSGSAAAEIARWDGALLLAEVRDDRGDFEQNVAELHRLIPRTAALPLPADGARALRIEHGWTFLGNALWYRGEKRAALVGYRQGLAALSDPRFDADARVLTRRAYAAFNIASVLDDFDAPAQALAAIRPALETVERLRLFDGSAAARNMENIIRLQLAVDLSDAGRFEEAIIEARRSLAGRRALAALQPGSYYSVRGVPVGLRPLAEVLEHAGRGREACATFADADRAWRALAARRPLSAPDRDGERGEVRKGLARCAAARR